MSSGYHHGDLPNALRAAAVEVIDERGLGGFSLREVARRAGVSHTAPAHHFGDVRGLLTSLACEGFAALHDVLAAARDAADVAGGTADDRLVAIGVAYVQLASSHRAHCDVMFRTDVVATDDEAMRAAGMAAYAVLDDVVRTIIERERLDVDVDTAVWMAWSTMQGLVQLNPKIDLVNAARGGEPVTTAELVERFSQLLLEGWRAAGTPARRRRRIS